MRPRRLISGPEALLCNEHDRNQHKDFRPAKVGPVTWLGVAVDTKNMPKTYRL